MPAYLLPLAFVALLPGDTQPRQPNPFAPSLPLLTDKEEARLDEIVNRFILFDTGKLNGAEGKKALADFQKLGPESIFALIRGLNRSANIESSCPAVTIARKIAILVRRTDDLELLEFARENIGMGVTQSRHMGVIKDLRVICITRKGALARSGVALRTAPRPQLPDARNLRTMTTMDLAELAGRQRGAALRPTLKELGQRDGEAALNALAKAAEAKDKDTRELGGEMLESYLLRQEAAFIKERLKDERPRVRVLAARVIGDKGWKLADELIGCLTDPDADVRQAARRSLVKLSGGKDFGPTRDESIGGQDVAARKWRDWWAKQGGR